MALSFDFNQEKNELLLATRGISFEMVILAIENGALLDNIFQSNQNHPQQRILVLRIEDYVYAVPYVFNLKKEQIFLKTVYPSRFLTKKYLKKDL